MSWLEYLFIRHLMKQFTSTSFSIWIANADGVISKSELNKNLPHGGGFRGSGNSKCMYNDLPLRWSEGENIAWRKSFKGYGQSTPVIWGDSIFSTSTLGDFSEQSLIHCHDLSDGSLKWQKSIQSPVKIERSQYVSQAAPSPVVV